MNRTKLCRFFALKCEDKQIINYCDEPQFDELQMRTIYLPGVFVEVDNDDDVAAVVVVARTDGLFDFDS